MSEAIKKIGIGYRCMKEKLNIRSNRIEIVTLIIFMSRQYYYYYYYNITD